MDYSAIIEARYNRKGWQTLLHDIFQQRVSFLRYPQPITADKNMAKQAFLTGTVTLSDGSVIAIYEVELSEHVNMERNRAGIRNLLYSDWRGRGCAGAFMLCFRQQETAVRFSYVSEFFTFDEQGAPKQERTDPKRFTYLVGEGHRSRTAATQFTSLKKSKQTLKDVTQAFSVEALSDIFFDEYKKHYEDIIEFITGKRMVKVHSKWEEKITGKPCPAIMQSFGQFPDAEKAVRDYVKKLMGRLVFIQFLQKKGWMGCSAGNAWTDGDKDFVQNLFNRTAHPDTFVDEVLEPLFHDLNTKRVGDLASSPQIGNNIKIPYLNGGLFEKDEYDRVDFPLPARFMKRLLTFFTSYNFTIDENDPDDAEIGVDPEMLGRIFENLLEDNKDKGAFYTPKELVQYMCREALVAYLQTDAPDESTQQAIRKFVTSHEADDLPQSIHGTIDQKLREVKICDPAIGSGAFPMGLLRELYACRKALEGIDDAKAVAIKTHIIQHNIYGVDIEKGAVDIARLRFWLALIVDEKNPHALPNMDFKIMQGNSLLEQYEGIDLSGMSVNEQKKKKAKKGEFWQQEFAFDEQSALANIQQAIKRYYQTDDPTQKAMLRGDINANVRQYILHLKGFTPETKEKLENLPIPNTQFFLWHIYFKEVFDKGGFDIVIGNPPYIDYRKIDPITKSGLSNYYSYQLEATGNLYVYFIELGIKILREHGQLIFINPYQYLTANSGRGIRSFIITQDHRLAKLVDVSNIKVFEADTYTCINTFSAGMAQGDILVYKPLDLRNLEMRKSIVKRENINAPDYAIYLSTNRVIAKLDQIDHKLKNCSRVVCGLSTKGFRNHVTDTQESNRHKPFVEAKQIKRYVVCPKKFIDTAIYSKKMLDTFNQCCLFMARMTSHMRVGVSQVGFAAGKINVISDYTCPLELLLGILNSKLLDYYYRMKCESLHFNGGALPFDTKSVKNLPIVLGEEKIQQDIISRVDKILEQKKHNLQADTNVLEAQIDQLVYQLYNLTPEEIALVEGKINS